MDCYKRKDTQNLEYFPTASALSRKVMKCVLIVFLHLIVGTSGFRHFSCLIAKKYGCNCTAQTLFCERLVVSVDIALPGIVPTDTRELTMKRVWVAEAIELTSTNFATLDRLRRIDFSQNRISEIHPRTFRYVYLIHLIRQGTMKMGVCKFSGGSSINSWPWRSLTTRSTAHGPFVCIRFLLVG